jgi:hypothetical protein
MLKEEHRLRVFENRVLRRLFGSERGKIAEGWSCLHSKELSDSLSSPSHRGE